MGKDSKLVLGLQSHRRELQDEALEQLYFRNLPLIEAYIQRNSGTKEDAEEVLQDSLVVLYQSVRKQDFQLTSKLDTFLYGIARNIWYKRLRKRRREVETVPMPDHESHPEWFVPETATHTPGENMLGLIRKMSMRCREILTMIYVEEKGMNEIKEALQYKSVQAVRNKKSNCLKKLREYFHSGQNSDRHV